MMPGVPQTASLMGSDPSQLAAAGFPMVASGDPRLSTCPSMASMGFSATAMSFSTVAGALPISYVPGGGSRGLVGIPPLHLQTAEAKPSDSYVALLQTLPSEVGSEQTVSDEPLPTKTASRYRKGFAAKKRDGGQLGAIAMMSAVDISALSPPASARGSTAAASAVPLPPGSPIGRDLGSVAVVHSPTAASPGPAPALAGLSAREIARHGDS
eukprot:RCo011080